MFLLQNQDGYFLNKSGSWSDGRDAKILFRTQHKDEAVNQLFEANSRDFSLRINIIECECNPKGLPIIESELLPPALTEPDEDQSSDSDTLETEPQSIAS